MDGAGGVSDGSSRFEAPAVTSPPGGPDGQAVGPTDKGPTGGSPGVAGSDDTLGLARRAPWPVADPAVYHGLLGYIVRHLDPHTEADPVAVLVQLLVGSGAMIGSGPYVPIDGARHGTNLFAVLVGATSSGRKGTSWRRVASILRQADPDAGANGAGGFFPDRVESGSSSGEGWIHRVRDPRYQVTEDGNRVLVEPGEDDKRLLVVEQEFSRALKSGRREANTLSDVMREAWDGGDLRTLTKHSAERATGAHIAFIGQITNDELQARLGQTDLFNGFANRILWTCVRRSKLLPRGAGAEPDLSGPAAELRTYIRRARVHLGAVELTADAAALWDVHYARLTDGPPGPLGAVTTRAAPQVLRLSLLYALLNGCDEIGADHLRSALALGDYCQQSAAWIFGTSTGDRLADDLVVKLRLSPEGLTRRQILDAFGRNQRVSRLVAALQRLAELELVRRDVRPSATRPAEVWYAV